MIKSKDRSGWIGASDTAMVMGNWNTATFQKWWMTKLGLRRDTFTTPAMQAGTHYEHRILDFLGIRRRDRQIKKRKLRLRVNLDGEDRITICEIKTHKSEQFKFSRAYWMQAQVEMFVTGKRLFIVAYRLTDAEYRNYFLPIDKARLSAFHVRYDPTWIDKEYLPRLRILAEALRKGVFPQCA